MPLPVPPEPATGDYDKLLADERDALDSEKVRSEKIARLSDDVSGLTARREKLKAEVEKVFLDRYRRKVTLSA